MLYSVFRQMVRLPEYLQTRVSKVVPHRLNRPFAAGLALTLTLAITGCAPSTEQVAEPEPNTTATPDVVVPKETVPPTPVETPDKADPPVEAQPDGTSAGGKQPEATDEMVTISVYTIDDQCNDFVEQSVEVPSSVAMDEAVGKVVGATQLNAFKLDGYQVNVDGNTAIVDNADWDVEAVKFTNAGKELVL